MSTEPKKPEAPAPQPPPAAPVVRKPSLSAAHALEVDAAIRAIGFIYYNTVNACWFSSTDRKQTLQESHSVIATVLEKLERLRFTADSHEIKVNGDTYEAGTVHVKALAAHLSTLEGCNFTFAKGLTLEEFISFMDVICKSESDLLVLGGLIDAVTKCNFQHVTSKRVILKEVSDEEVIVSKIEIEATAAEERKRIESDVLSFLTAPAAAPGAEADTEKASSLRKAVQNSEQMANLIMQTVDKKQGGGAAVDKQQVTQIVVECLDRAFAALLDDPFSKTQKGKKAIAGALQRLEKELLTKMQVAPEQEESQQVTTAVERMTERLKMDSVVQEYSKKLKALEESEKRILRFIKLQGLDKKQDPELEKRLSEEGVDVSDWHRLLALGRDDEGHTAVTQLAQLIGHLEADVTALQEKPDSVSAEKITNELRQVNSEVRVVTERTREKIDGLIEAVNADMAAVAGLEKEAEKTGLLKMPRKRMLVLLTEVVQELKQPLVVIGCAMDMLKAKALGEVNPAQMEMLQMTEESAIRIKTLIDNLEAIAGQPKTLQPDQEMQKALNKRETPSPAPPPASP